MPLHEKTKIIRNILKTAECDGVKTPAFIALVLTYHDYFDDGRALEDILEELDMPVSQKWQLKSYLKVPEELRKLGKRVVTIGSK